MSDAIFHITTPAEWGEAQITGVFTPASLTTEGFVHCSTGAQVEGSIARHFGDHDELVLLELRHDTIADALRWEEGRPGEEFPHVYRALTLADVADATSWHRGSAASPSSALEGDGGPA